MTTAQPPISHAATIPTPSEHYRSLLPDRTEGPQGVDPSDDTLACPIAVLKDAAVQANITAMQERCTSHIELAPRGKTTMAPDLFARQLAAGASGRTVATPVQARIALAAGTRQVLTANQVTDRTRIRWVGATLAADPTLSLLCYVDSLDGVRLLDEGLTDMLPGSTQLEILLELGATGGRTGLREDADVPVVSRAVADSPRAAAGRSRWLRARGRGQRCRWRLLVLRPRVARVLTGGDNTDPDDLAEKPVVVVLRSGVYITDAHGLYAPGSSRSYGPEAGPRVRGVGAGAPLPRTDPRDRRCRPPLPSLRPEPAPPRWSRCAAGRAAKPLTATGRPQSPARVPRPARRRGPAGRAGGQLRHLPPVHPVDKWNLLVDSGDRVSAELAIYF